MKWATLFILVIATGCVTSQSFTNPAPLVDGSEVLVVGSRSTLNKKYYELSNGNRVLQSDLPKIREISALFPGAESIVAEELLGFRIVYDRVDQVYFIYSGNDPGSWGSFVRVYIGTNSNGHWIRMKLHYYGDDWLFVQRYKIAADDYRWESPFLSFERDHARGFVWEWIDKVPTEQDLENMRLLAEARNPTIRFQGRQYHHDFKVPRAQQAAIRDVLNLHSVLKNAKR